MIGPAGVAALLDHDEQPARAQAWVLLELLDDEGDVRVDHGRPRRDYLPIDARLSQHALHRRVMDAAALVDMVRLKRHWRVSTKALVVRAHRVGVLSEWAYRSMCIDLQASHGISEPEPMANHETSQILTKVFASLREDGLTKADVAQDLRVYPFDVDALVFGLTMATVARAPMLQGRRHGRLDALSRPGRDDCALGGRRSARLLKTERAALHFA
jgi:hypothetical protein